MGSTYTKTKHIGGEPTKAQRRLRRTVYLAAYLAAAGMALAVIVTIVGAIRSEGNDTAVEIKPTHGTLNELTEPEAFTRAYLSVNCNAMLLKSTQTIRIAGLIQSGGNQQAFSLIKKRPDRMLLTIDRGSHEMAFGVSEATVWRRIRSPQHEELVALIEGEEAQEWLEQRRFFDRIISAAQGTGSITAIQATTWQETACLQVSTLDTEGTAVDILIDPQTMYPIAELQTLSDGTIKQTVFSDYRNIDGMPIPFGMATSVDDEQQSSIRLNSAKLNSGVLSKLFDVPKSLLVKN